ncbi:MAG TPA: DUF5818 domain-containing protein [Terriglobia bacterium]|nr:DUF5818 domain-containing protein [Terriglobia bacterium]
MKPGFRPLWLLSVLFLGVSVGAALGQQGEPQNQSPAQAAPPSSQSAEPQGQPPTSDQPAPPPNAQSAQPGTDSGTQNSPQGTPPMNGQNGNTAATPTPRPPEGGMNGQAGQTPGQTGQAAQPGAVQAFSGTIVKVGDKYKLQDESTGQTYDLDHQDEVQKYAGRRVRVHGTLDATGKVIHLQ